MGRKPEGTAEKMFKKFGKNVDAVISDIKDSKDYAALNIDKRVSELHKNKESIENHMNGFSENTKSKWEQAKPNFERAGQEFRKAMNTFFTNRAYR